MNKHDKVSRILPSGEIADSLGAGDGSQTVFYTSKSPVKDGSLTVKVDGGTVAPEDYFFNRLRGRIVFDTAPGNGLAVDADSAGVVFIPSLPLIRAA